MASKPEGSKPHLRFGALILLGLGFVAVTPLLAAIVVAGTGPQRWVVAAGVAGWAALVGSYQSMVSGRDRSRRRRTSAELEQSLRSRDRVTGVVRCRLTDQDAILDRIVTISESILRDGITDPRLTLDSVRLVGAHARDARALIEDAITELKLETHPAPAEPSAVDVRDEIEQVVSRFPGAGIMTTGTRHIAMTDPAMFRVAVRSLVAAAVSRRASEIDVSLAGNGPTVVCTVSDNGPPFSSVPPLANALSRSMGTSIEASRRMNGNHFSFALELAPRDTDQGGPADPLDVLGMSRREESRETAPPPATIGEQLSFPEPVARDRSQTVAARRKHLLISR
jgi:hypothetical protein